MKRYRRKGRKSNYGKKIRSTPLKTKGRGLVKAFPLGRTFKYNARYVEHKKQLNPTSGLVVLKYNLMALSAPNFTVGHQPMGFDQVMPMYNHYTVIGVKATVLFANLDTANTQQVGLFITSNSTSLTDYERAVENGNCRTTTLGTSNSGTSCKTLSINFSPTKFFNKRAIVGDSLYRGTSITQPQESAYLQVACIPNSGTDANEVRFTIILDFISILTEPKELGKS